MEEAPSSPRSAALYYWGGNHDTSNGIMDDVLPKSDDFYWEEVVPPSAHLPTVEMPSSEHPIASMKEWGRRYNVTSRDTLQTRRSHLKFSLPIRDDDDDSHWMLLRPHSQTISLGGCFVENEAEACDHCDEDEDIDDERSEAAPMGSLDASIVENDPSEQTDDFATQNNFHSIPIIDLSLPLLGPKGYASQIAEACRTSGFFYIVNHGVDPSLMRDVMDKSRDFFALSVEDKAACGYKGEDTTSSGHRGYFGIGMEDLENKDGTRDLVREEGGNDVQRTKGDQKEGFDCGLECLPGYHEVPMSRQAYIDFFGENYWPDECFHATIVGFRRTLIEYQKALLKLSDVLMIAFAVSLSSHAHGTSHPDGEAPNGALPMDYFISRSRNPMCTLRLLHYPPTPPCLSNQSNERLTSPSGCGAHTDYGLFTILYQDDIGGLQVRNKSNQWIDARPLPGSFVINVGDMLSWWTEGEYASTVHRVISPKLLDGDDENGTQSGDRDDVGRHRYSIPFFFNPDHDALVRPIKDADADFCGNRKWKTAIEILRERYAGTFKSK